VELYLSDCINSLINQTYANIEIVLVNDGSPDNCGKICDEYAQKDSRIKVVHKENGGLVSARNAGFDASTGDWVMYVDGDDWIDIKTCEILDNYIRDFNPDLIFWNILSKFGEQSIVKMKWKSTENIHLYQNVECKELSVHTLVYTSGIATACTKLIKRKFCEENRLIHNPNLKQGIEGIEFSTRVFYAAHTALYVNKFLTYNRYNPNSISKSINEKNTQYIVDGFIELQKFINTLPEKDMFQPKLHQRALYALIAVAMGTYFHPQNKDTFFTKINKFKHIIKSNDVFHEALKYGDFKEVDIRRRIILFLIRHKFYFMLFPIAGLKYFLLKKIKIFNYK
jgi:glycosyltransferase involved in cell wall biosynthesis